MANHSVEMSPEALLFRAVHRSENTKVDYKPPARHPAARLANVPCGKLDTPRSQLGI